VYGPPLVVGFLGDTNGATEGGPASWHSDADAAPALIEDEPPGTEVLGDAAYSAGDLRSHLEDKEMTAVIKPMPLRPAVDGGFTLDDFDVDEAAGAVTCPAGVKVKINGHGRARFGKHCASCPMKTRCTKSKAGRTIVLNENHALLATARSFATTVAFDDTYRNYRPMIERTIAWLVRGQNRRLRYIGRERNRLWLFHRAAAVNLKRLLNLGLSHDGRRFTMART
jgi:Transposase DDE domain